MVLEGWMPLSNDGLPMPWNRATDRITHAGNANSVEFHNSGARSNRAAACDFVAYSYYSFQCNSLFTSGKN